MIKGIDYPNWMTEEGLKTLTAGYLLPNETVKEMYTRVAKAAHENLKDFAKLKTIVNTQTGKLERFEQRIFRYLWDNWLCLSTPIASNFGTTRAMPISCYVLNVEDTTESIYNCNTEMALLTKGGGGVGTCWSDVRPRGSKISVGGKSEGIVPFLKVYDSTIIATSQGSTRRGAASINLDIEHGDFNEFLNIKRAEGDEHRRCIHLHQCAILKNDYVSKLKKNDEIAKDKWFDLLKTRMEVGEPYVAFYDNIMKARPNWYQNYDFKGVNICAEVIPFLKSDETYTCCLSSANIVKFDEWKSDIQFIKDCIYFLNSVLNEFLIKTKNGTKSGFLKTYNFAKRHRSVGLGWLGLHTYLQQHSIPFVSLEHRYLTNIIGKKMWEEGWEASKELAEFYGEPEVMTGHGYYNAQLFAIAPTTSNSLISGGVSQGVEPIMANIYNQVSAKGTFIRMNPTMNELLINKYNFERDSEQLALIWKIILQNNGSVQNLDFLSKEDKEIFKTFEEINQFEIIKLAALRQKYIDQAQSINLCVNPDISTKTLSDIHKLGLTSGLKTLYYLRSDTKLKGDMITNLDHTSDYSTSKTTQTDDCLYCQS